MNTQLLRYNVFNEHPSFPPIPHPVGWFRANGSHPVHAAAPSKTAAYFINRRMFPTARGEPQRATYPPRR